MPRFTILLISLALFSISAANASEDWRTQGANDFVPQEASSYMLGLSDEVSINDAIFYSQDQLPSASELTPTEKFMLLGGTSRTGGYNRSWISEVSMVCRAYESRFHAVPDQLTPEVLAAVFECSVEEAATFSFFKNQLTGDWLKCNATNPSAGDIYLRTLTTQEAVKVSQKIGNLSLILRDQPFMIDGKPEYEHLIGDVWYCRVYGEGGRVIATFAPMVSAPGRS